MNLLQFDEVCLEIINDPQTELMLIFIIEYSFHFIEYSKFESFYQPKKRFKGVKTVNERLFWVYHSMTQFILYTNENAIQRKFSIQKLRKTKQSESNQGKAKQNTYITVL